MAEKLRRPMLDAGLRVLDDYGVLGHYPLDGDEEEAGKLLADLWQALSLQNDLATKAKI